MSRKPKLNPETMIGARIKEARKLAGMGQDEVAVALGLTVASVSYREQGAVPTTSVQLAKLCRLLKQPPAFFFQDLLQ